jgi:hypothetical protein
MLLLSCHLPASAGPAAATCRVTSVTSAQQPAANRQPLANRRFSATRVLDLDFEAVTPRRLAAGPHVLELRVYTPQGHLYQVLPAAFLAEERVKAKKAKLKAREAYLTVAGYPRPLLNSKLKAAVLEGVERELVALRLPVAGTPILSHSLYGRWSVEPHVDGSPKACGPALKFWIAQ